MQASGVDLAVEDIVKRGSPVMGTCAGLVMLSSGGCEEVEKTGQTLLGLADVELRGMPSADRKKA